MAPAKSRSARPRRREPGEQDEIACTVLSLADFGHLGGTIRLPGGHRVIGSSGHRVVCGCLAMRDDDGPDWLDFYLPMGALARVDDRIGGFPFDEDSGRASLTWRRALDDWLATVGAEIFREVDFRLGLIGFELSGDTDAQRLNGTAPAERWEGYLLPVRGNLHYEPANR